MKLIHSGLQGKKERALGLPLYAPFREAVLKIPYRDAPPTSKGRPTPHPIPHPFHQHGLQREQIPW